MKSENIKIEFETFRKLGDSDILSLKQISPSCINGNIIFRKYKITMELIDEPNDVLAERLLKLWRECGNYDHQPLLIDIGRSIGIELPKDEYGNLYKTKI